MPSPFGATIQGQEYGRHRGWHCHYDLGDIIYRSCVHRDGTWGSWTAQTHVLGSGRGAETQQFGLVTAVKSQMRPGQAQTFGLPSSH